MGSKHGKAASDAASNEVTHGPTSDRSAATTNDVTDGTSNAASSACSKHGTAKATTNAASSACPKHDTAKAATDAADNEATNGPARASAGRPHVGTCSRFGQSRAPLQIEFSVG